MAKQRHFHRPALGKVILLGEHSVVYGHPAVAGAIDRTVVARAAKTSEPGRLRAPHWNIDVSRTDAHPAARAFDALLSTANVANVDVEVETNLPCAAGLGSSAALSVALARAVVLDQSPEQEETLAKAAEACFHQNPSGVDIVLSARGGLGVYTRETGLTPLDTPPITMVIALSDEPRQTSAMVQGVKDRMQRDATAREAINAIAALTKDGTQALVEGDMKRFGSLMDQCHTALCQLGVSTARMNQMVKIAKDSGALGAKLTGAGGGGAVIALCPEKELDLVSRFNQKGFSAFATTVGGKV